MAVTPRAMPYVGVFFEGDSEVPEGVGDVVRGK